MGSEAAKKRRIVMLYYTIVFLVVALIAGILGFGVVAGTAALIAKFCFVLFLVLFVVSLLSGRGRATPL